MSPGQILAGLLPAGARLVKAVGSERGQHVTEADLQSYCRTRLSAFEIPKKIYFVSRFPRTSKGDTDRRALAAALAN